MQRNSPVKGNAISDMHLSESEYKAVLKRLKNNNSSEVEK